MIGLEIDLWAAASAGDPDDPAASETIELCTADGIPLVTADGNYIGVTG